MSAGQDPADVADKQKRNAQHVERLLSFGAAIRLRQFHKEPFGRSGWVTSTEVREVVRWLDLGSNLGIVTGKRASDSYPI
jgi:hypothetical protein